MACLRWIYYLIGHSPEVYSASSTVGHSHSLLVVCHAIILVILLATQLWNPSSNFSISPIATQLTLPYNNTDYTTSLYIISCARIDSLIFVTNLSTIYHRRRTFQIL